MNSVDYWRDREEKNREKHIKEEKEYEKELENIYSRELDAIENRIYSFYSRYATVEGITIAEARKRVSNHDVKEFSETAKRYVQEKNFSERANEELRLYNLTMRVNYQELLKYQIALETCATSDELETFMKEKLEGRTIEEIERQAGILGESLLDQTDSVKSVVNASFHNATFSDRVWANQSILRSNLENILTNAMIQGRNPRDYISQIRKTCNVSRYQAERLLRTELSRVQADAQMKCYEEADFDEYIYHALGSGACDECKVLDKQHFKLVDAEIGVNMFPMHPNCRCSTGPYMDTEEFDKWLNSIDEHGLTWEEWKDHFVHQHKNGSKVKITDQAINKIKSVKPFGYSDRDADYATELRKELLRYSKENNDSDEVLCLMDIKGNIHTNFIKGNNDSVDLFADPDTFHTIFKSEMKTLELIHNHPGLSYFSLNDLNIFMMYPSIKTMTVVTNQGKTWYINKLDSFDIKKAQMIMKEVTEKYSDNDKIVEKFLKKGYIFGVERN